MKAKQKIMAMMVVASVMVGGAVAQTTTTTELDSPAITHEYPSDGATVYIEEDGDVVEFEAVYNFSALDSSYSSLDYNINFHDSDGNAYVLDSGTFTDVSGTETVSGEVDKATLNSNNISSSDEPVYYYSNLVNDTTTVEEENTTFTITNDRWDYMFDLMVGILGIMVVLAVFSELF